MADKFAYGYAKVYIPAGALSTKALVGDLLPEANVLVMFDSDRFTYQGVGFIPDGVGSSTGNWVIDNGPPPTGIGAVVGTMAELGTYEVECKVVYHDDGTCDTEVRVDGVVLGSYTNLPPDFYGFDNVPDGFAVGQWLNIEQYQPGGTVGVLKAGYSKSGYIRDGGFQDFFYDFTTGDSNNFRTGDSGGTTEDPFDDGSGFAGGGHFAGPEVFGGTDVWGSFGGGGVAKYGIGFGDGAVTYPPFITSFFPEQGTDGTQVVIKGGNFTGATKVEFNTGENALFDHEGPDLYDAAYAHNSPFAQGGPYQTALDQPGDEAAFRAWVVYWQIPFDVNAATVDYDMRGYWLAQPGHSATSPPHNEGDHFPDTYKTPYDTTFSNESRWATPDCPFQWLDDALIDTRDNSLIFGVLPKDAESFTVVSDTQINAVAPAFVATGKLHVTGPGGIEPPPA